MTIQKKIEWLLLAATAILFLVLKWLHIGTTHYNVFLLIIMGWCLMLVIAFRILGAPDRLNGAE